MKPLPCHHPIPTDPQQPNLFTLYPATASTSTAADSSLSTLGSASLIHRLYWVIYCLRTFSVYPLPISSLSNFSKDSVIWALQTLFSITSFNDAYNLTSHISPLPKTHAHLELYTFDSIVSPTYNFFLPTFPNVTSLPKSKSEFFYLYWVLFSIFLVHSFPMANNTNKYSLVSHLNASDVANILIHTCDSERDVMWCLLDGEMEERHYRQREQHERWHRAMCIAYAGRNNWCRFWVEWVRRGWTFSHAVSMSSSSCCNRHVPCAIEGKHELSTVGHAHSPNYLGSWGGRISFITIIVL